jgi:uronate dehydrogenase
MKTILITGAAGIVGRAIRPELARHHEHVLLTDIQPVGDLAPGESFAQGDLADFTFLKSIVADVDGIVHLGGLVGADQSFEDLLGPNIIGTHNIFEAARLGGMSRIVYASSAHCVGFIKRGEPIDHRTPHRPNGEYAVSKAYGELAASYYSDKFGLNVLAVRIGYVGSELTRERRLRTWVSARDLVQLMEIGLSRDVGFEITYGVSDNPEPFSDNSNAFRLGYLPQDRSVDFLTDRAVLYEQPKLDTIEGGVVGGGFAAAGFEGDPARILGK